MPTLVKLGSEYIFQENGVDIARVFPTVGMCNRPTGRYAYQIGQKVVWNPRYTSLKDLILKVTAKLNAR